MSLFDFLNFNKNNVLNEIEGNNLLKGVNTNTPEYAESMGVNYQPRQGIYDRIMNGLLGTPTKSNDTVTMTTDENGNPMINSTVENSPRQGGILRDIAAGYRENRDNGFSLDNWGKNKNIAQRIGEGLGSAARIAESPLGRSLLVGAAVGLTGGNPLQMLAYGSQTGALNQANRTADKLYRDALLDAQKQSLMNNTNWNTLSDTEKQQALADLGNEATEEQKQAALQNYLTNRQQNALNTLENNVYRMPGYVNKDMFNSMMTAQQLRDNAEYRNLYLSNQQEQNRIMNQLRADQLDFQRGKEAFDRMIAGEKMSIDRQRLALEWYNAQNKSKNDAAVSPDDQILEMGDMFKNLLQNKTRKGTQKITGWTGAALNAMGYGSKEIAAYDSVADALATALARRNGEKGNLSDGDIKRWRKALPSITDTPEQAQAKFDSLHRVYGYPKVDLGLTSNTQENKTNTNNNKPTMDVDRNALEAELKRRGLK